MSIDQEVQNDLSAFDIAFDASVSGSEPTPVETPPVETPPVETPPVETPPVETPPAEPTPAEPTPAEPTPVETPPVETPPVETPPVETPPVETPPVETPPVETPPVETPPVETPPVETPPVETPPVETSPVETPLVETTPVETPPVETPPVEPPTAYQFTTEEQAVLDAAFELYPELPQVVALIEKRITETQNAVRAFELQRVSAELAQRFAPALSEAQMSAQQRWLTQVQAQHPDILTIRDNIISWVETQPAILRQAYNRVLDGGTVQETIELADIYKKSIAPPVKPTPTVVPPKVDPKVEAQLDEQEAIKSRATAKVGEYVDANDFDSAFKLAAG